jgi:hypothetical protein
MTTRRRHLVNFVSSKLAWGRVYRASSYLKSALWTVPLIAIALELLLSGASRRRAVHRCDQGHLALGIGREEPGCVDGAARVCPARLT